MDGILIVHAKTGHILFSKAYTEGYGLNIEANDDTNVQSPPGKKDPMVASMLLANFICAFYTNVLNLVDESVFNSTDDSLQQLMRDPLQSFDTGSNGPLLFFRRHAEANVLCALFLQRTLVTNESAATSTDLHSTGEWLVQEILSSFVSTYRTELAAKPFRASTKTFKPFGKQVEDLYTAAFSKHLLEATLEHVAKEWRPSWMYVLYSEQFGESMDRVNLAPSIQQLPTSQNLSRRKVADLSDDIVPSAPSFVPHPPSTPGPSSSLVAAQPSSQPSSSSTFFAARPVNAKLKHPFQAPRRRWWHFGGSKETLPIFYTKLGRTTCLYSISGSKSQSPPEKPQEEEKQPSPDPSLPSPDAIHKLIALVHNAGQVLSSPSEFAGDKLNWMEMTLAAPAVKSAVVQPVLPPMKFWILRIQDLILAFPTGSSSAGESSSDLTPKSHSSLSFTELLASLQPFLSCLNTHYAFVSTIHERNYRTLQKNMEKAAAAAAAAK